MAEQDIRRCASGGIVGKIIERATPIGHRQCEEAIQVQEPASHQGPMAARMHADVGGAWEELCFRAVFFLPPEN